MRLTTLFHVTQQLVDADGGRYSPVLRVPLYFRGPRLSLLLISLIALAAAYGALGPLAPVA